MNSHKEIAIKFVILVLLGVFVWGHAEVRCIAREREALVSFKNGLIDEFDILSSWRGDECCNWYGVVCSNTSTDDGQVIRLELDARDYYGVLGGNVSSSLLELHHFNYLDLSWNDFGGHPIPESIGSMKKLEHLYLWGCNFSGIIPPQLGNLTNLLTLDLSSNSLKSKNLNWLSNLSSLSYLDLSYNSLKSENLNGLSNLSSLSYLDLSYNSLKSENLNWLSNLSSLSYLDLSYNSLKSENLNWLSNLSSLSHLNLTSNSLKFENLNWLSNLSSLQVLVMYDNHLRGRLDDFIGNLSSKGFLSSLQILDLGRNQFDGPIPDLRVFSGLTEVYLGDNNFTGSLPLSVGHLISKLRILDVSSNHLEGVVSESHFTKLDNLEILDLSLNSLSFDVAQDWNPPFQLTYLSLASCNMGPSFPKWIQTQKNLWNLDLSSAGIIIDQVPMWLWSFSPSLQILFLSDNQISGTIPDLSSIFIEQINLSSNKITDSIPLFHPNTKSFDLSRNMFSGSISSSFCKFPHDELMFLDLSNNQLSGELPNCWEKMPTLYSLYLANNSFSGKMPHSLPDRLRTLSLSCNNLSGVLPSTLRFYQELSLIDVGGNKLTGEIPSWIGGLVNMQFLNLRSNEFYGGIPAKICNLTLIRVLDISKNKLSGRIPNCFNYLAALADKDATHADDTVSYDDRLDSYIYLGGLIFYNRYSSFVWKGQESEYSQNLDILKLIDISSNRLSGTIPHSFSSMKGLISLNLSRNSLTGNIIPNIGQMEMLECLDLSHNQLSGEIPMSLAQLHFLDVLDLSNNSLSGKIPSSTQLQSFNTSSYAGNNGLCGLPLPLCPHDSPRPPTPTQGEEDDDDFWRLSFMQGLGISIAFGFIVGFWGAVGSLVLKKSWRYAFFNLLDDVVDWCYVRISIFLSKCRQS